MNAQTYITADKRSDKRSEDDAEADCRKVAVLLDQTIDALPEDTHPAERPTVAYEMVAKMLAFAVRRGLLPVRGHAGLLAGCRSALFVLPPAETLAAFQAAAKAALREAVL